MIPVLFGFTLDPAAAMVRPGAHLCSFHAVADPAKRDLIRAWSGQKLRRA
ncbi:MAG: hypothetical protein H7145_21960 [Akkermansiaceae bacterium]|nr:hypothetical protein [Armatimonadota bacterium]